MFFLSNFVVPSGNDSEQGWGLERKEHCFLPLDEGPAFSGHHQETGFKELC